MLTYEDALARILASVEQPLPTEQVPLEEALGRALAADLFAPFDLPLFDNSMVDGFAVRQASVGAASEALPLSLPIAMEIPAGGWPSRTLRPGEAARIFTGAPIPDGCDAIVMVEDTDADEDDESRVTLRDSGAAHYIRRRGSDLSLGALALPAGITLGPGELGVLASLNQALIGCPRQPRVGVLSTGNELVPVGAQPLPPGHIRNSNGPALAAAIQAAGGLVMRQEHARDTPAEVTSALAALADCDLILSSGGVSVGDHDHVRAALEQQGTLDFWRVAIKPGKPLAFGKLGGALFFGLPGNPASSLVTFELFVRPILRRLAGHRRVERPTLMATLTVDLPHSPGRREFVRASLSGTEATPTGAQGSHRTASMASADALLIAHEERGDYAAGEVLPALLLR